MANVAAVRMATSSPDVSITLYYNDTNNRLSDVVAELTANIRLCRISIYRDGGLIYERIEVGPATVNEGVAGNIKMVESLDENGQPFIDLPPEITYSLQIEETII